MARMGTVFRGALRRERERARGSRSGDDVARVERLGVTRVARIALGLGERLDRQERLARVFQVMQ